MTVPHQYSKQHPPIEGEQGTPARYIEIINAKSMQYVNAIAVEDAMNLAGITFDQTKKYLNKTANYDIMFRNPKSIKDSEG